MEVDLYLVEQMVRGGRVLWCAGVVFSRRYGIESAPAGRGGGAFLIPHADGACRRARRIDAGSESSQSDVGEARCDPARGFHARRVACGVAVGAGSKVPLPDGGGGLS